MSNLCNLNGVITPEAKTTISVLDRGFLFGDSIYEVLGTNGGVPFAFPEHLERLRASADGLRMRIEVDDRTILRRIKATLAEAKNQESYVRIIVTRGIGTAPNIDLVHAPGPCTVLILVRPLPAMPGGEGNLAIIDRMRNDRRALDPAFKTGNYLNNVLGLAEAKAQGASDAVFLNGAGCVTEASTSNVWIVEDSACHTPPLEAGLLSGITRRLLLAMCREQGLRYSERDLTKRQLLQADEVFTTSTLRHVYPITKLDGQAVRDGKPGPITTDLAKRFDTYCARRLAQVYAPEWSTL